MQLFMLFFLSSLLTGLVRHYALSRNVIDVPNHRSSHTIPTPRGGGIAFVGVFLLYLIYFGVVGSISQWMALGLFIAGLSVAVLGFVDDHVHIASKYRLLGHFLASGFALYSLGGMPSIFPIAWQTPELAIFMNLVALFYLVWLLNLYNFMDGINGLAAIEVITVCLSGAMLYGVCGYFSLMILPLVLAVVVSGFLCWNFPVARIFMGDVGSGFVGLMIGLFSIQAAHIHIELFWAWLILSGVFIVDATLTLFIRIWNGRRLDEAHRSHAYQRLTDMLGSHVKVTLGVLVINVVWLLPLAFAVSMKQLNPLVGLVIAYLPLIAVVFYLYEKS